MDISSSGPTQPGSIRDQHRVQSLGHASRRAEEASRRQQAADEAIISEQGQFLQRLARAVRESPEVREDRVAELRQAIQDGRYQVSAAEIAKALLASRMK